jgi:hypothetical protein
LNRFLLLAGVVFATSVVSSAQSVPTVNDAPTTWELFGGGTFERGVSSTLPENLYGWDTSVSERPYASYPWVGGTIEASGSYHNSTATASNIVIHGSEAWYTVMGGPSVAFRVKRVQPFARVLLGEVVDSASASANGQSVSSSTKHFGTSMGGGVDVAVNRRFALRAQADWLWWREDSQSVALVRTSVGGVFRF